MISRICPGEDSLLRAVMAKEVGEVWAIDSQSALQGSITGTISAADVCTVLEQQLHAGHGLTR